MSKNIYKETLSNITVSQEALSKALETARNFKEDKVMKTHKIIKFRATATIAASLAVVIALSAVFFGYMGRNSFTLTAYAAVIGKDAFVKVGNLNLSASGASWQREGDLITNISARGFFNLDIKCKGKDIETVTYKHHPKYTASNTEHSEYLLVDDSYSGLIEYDEFSDGNLITTVQQLKPASSCTFDYDNQPQSNKTEFLEYTNGVDGNFPLLVFFKYEDIENKFEANIDKYLNTDKKYAHLSEDSRINIPLEEILCDADELGCIDITATFTDGTTETQTLQFKCEKDENKTYLTAKIK